MKSIEKNIPFTKSESIQIYEKLKFTYNAMSKSQYYKKPKNSLRSVFKTDYYPLLKEMHMFLETHKNDLKDEQGFNALIREIHSDLIEKREYEDLTLALSATNRGIVVKALLTIQDKIKYSKDYFDSKIFTDLANKVLFKSSPALNDCLHILTSWSWRQEKHLEKEHLSLLVSILESYHNFDYKRLDLNYFMTCFSLSKIAEMLKTKGMKNKIIDYWSNIVDSGYFNRCAFDAYGK